jgi:hypothetical protein
MRTRTWKRTKFCLFEPCACVCVNAQTCVFMQGKGCPMMLNWSWSEQFAHLTSVNTCTLLSVCDVFPNIYVHVFAVYCVICECAYGCACVCIMVLCPKITLSQPPTPWTMHARLCQCDHAHSKWMHVCLCAGVNVLAHLPRGCMHSHMLSSVRTHTFPVDAWVCTCLCQCAQTPSQ